MSCDHLSALDYVMTVAIPYWRPILPPVHAACPITQLQRSMLAEAGDPYDNRGKDTGHTFTSPRTGDHVRVIAKRGEAPQAAIHRVRRNHGAA